MKKLILLSTMAISSLTLKVDTGTVLNEHYVEFGDTGRGYYTEHGLSNIGDDVIVVGDMMIVDESITYLK